MFNYNPRYPLIPINTNYNPGYSLSYTPVNSLDISDNYIPESINVPIMGHNVFNFNTCNKCFDDFSPAELDYIEERDTVKKLCFSCSIKKNIITSFDVCKEEQSITIEINYQSDCYEYKYDDEDDTEYTKLENEIITNNIIEYYSYSGNNHIIDDDDDYFMIDNDDNSDDDDSDDDDSDDDDSDDDDSDDDNSDDDNSDDDDSDDDNSDDDDSDDDILSVKDFINNNFNYYL